MNKLIVLFVFVFLAAWGISLFLTFISGMSKMSSPVVSEEQGPNYLEEQKIIAADAEEQRKKIMEDLRYKIQRQKSSNPLPSYNHF